MRSSFALASLACGFLLGAGPLAAQISSGAVVAPWPFANSNVKFSGLGLPRGFVLSHDYPTTLPPKPASFPWDAAINNGLITVKNAGAYVNALKQYVSADMRVLLFDWDQWNAGARGWYNEPWLANEREPIHGLYIGMNDQSWKLWPGTGLTVDWGTYCLSLYDTRAATMLSNFWGADALNPKSAQPAPAQFPEGAIVLKLAFSGVNATPSGTNPLARWPVLAGAAQWKIYFTQNVAEPELTNKIGPVSLFQFDIVVKDSKASPKTGWVFTTFVYDKDAPGQDAWDKMVPLGAMWGNDPAIDSSKPNPPPLTENWIYEKAPAYSKLTLGWGDRLAGPNDGARGPAVYQDESTGKIVHVPSQGYSSCLSCHGSAAWPYPNPGLMMPSPSSGPAVNAATGNENPIYQPGSAQWNQWFQSRAGTVPQVPGTVALDYDMVTGFKSMNQWQVWQKSTLGPAQNPNPTADYSYNGRRRRAPAAPATKK